MDPLSITGLAGVAVLGAAVLASRALAKLQRYVTQSEGLKILYEDHEPEIDIVCVHGLGGDPVETWTSRNDRGAVNWTKDFLPKNIESSNGSCRDIRVLTYGYSSKLFTGLPGGTFAQPMDARALKYLPQALYLHSNRLIEQLADLRAGNAEKRPVIFVAHSLGGLIVKSALVHASAAIGEPDVRLKGIELLTIGALFFGTPQREMRWAKWSELLTKMFHAGMHTPLSVAIQPLADQAELLNLQIERYKSIESNFYNFSFWERAKSRKGRSDSTWVVNEDDYMPINAKGRTWRKVPLQRAHKDLAKFNSKKDPDFLKVLSCINQCFEAINYQSALERHSLFFTHIDSPRNSDVDLVRATQEATVNWAKLNPKPVRVNSSDSEKEINDKLETNKRSLTASEKAYGLADSTTLTLVRQMASDAFQTGDYKKAEALYKRLFVSTQEIYAPCSEEVRAVLKHLAEVAVCQGRLVEATKTLLRVRKIDLCLGLKEDDSEILKVTEQIGDLYESRGLHDDALLEYGKIITQLKNISGTMGVEMLRVRELEANVWRQKGKKDRSALAMAESKSKELIRDREKKEVLSQKSRQANGYGLKTLWPLDNASDRNAIVDIVLVHELGSLNRGAWTRDGVLWPQRILSKDFPLARILTWSYDADAMRFFGPAGSEASLSDHARSLVWDLSQERVEDYQIQRPIIFIAHGLGGLIVKDALCISYLERANKNLEDVNENIAGIKQCTRCLILAGTPHHGADTARWSAMATKLARLTQKDGSDIVAQSLAGGWRVVEELQSRFIGIMPQFAIYSLWEQLRHQGIGIIVEKDLALIGGHETQIPIHANHSDMVKFKAKSDRNYEVGFRNVIRDILGIHIKSSKHGKLIDSGL